MRSALFLALLCAAGCSTTDDGAPRRRPPHKSVASRLRPALPVDAAPADHGELEVHVIDVGHGDAILVRCPDDEHQLLIDTGELNERWHGSEERFKTYFERVQAEDDPLEVVVLSHPDGDAMGSMRWLLRHYQVEYYVDNGCTSPFKSWNRIEDQLAKSPPPYYLNVHASQEKVIDIDFCPRADVSAVILRPASFGTSAWLDDNSLVVRVDHGQRSFLFTGDLDETLESDLSDDAELAPLLDCDFLKVPRHGASTSSTADFLAAVSPTVAAISCGIPKGINKFAGQPRLETVRRLEPYLRQRDDGPVSVSVCDGQGERPEEVDQDTGIYFFVEDPGEWIKIELSAALYLTAAEGDLLFLSDGERIWRATPPSNPRPRSESDQ